MLTYPDIESWDEFYPSEVYIIMEITDEDADMLAVIKKANLGTKIYIGMSADETLVYKKVGQVKDLDTMYDNLVLLEHVKMATP